MKLFRNQDPGTSDAPVPREEMAAWNGVLNTMEELDKQAGITSPDTTAARAGYWAAVEANWRRK